MAYTPEEKELILNDIFSKISEGESLRAVLRADGMPTAETFYRWIEEDKVKSKQYARACESRADVIFEDILNIADDNGNDTRYTDDGDEVTNHDVIQRSRLRVDARKWVLAKMNPRKYGDKLDLTSDNEKIEPLSITAIKKELKELLSEDDSN